MAIERAERKTPWILKAAVQGITSRLPAGEYINTLMQRYVTGSLKLDEARVHNKFGRALRHLEQYARFGRAADRPPRIIELGTGWFPIAPVAFALCGAEKVWAVDNVSHLWPEHVLATLRLIYSMARRGDLPAIRRERFSQLQEVLASPPEGVDEMLAAIGVTNVLGDARALKLGEEPIDLIVSNNTLEHVPAGVLFDMFSHWRSLVAPGTVMSHWIDLSDHYMSFDPSIGPYNFLKFSSPVWRLFNNPHQYQNRFRVCDFRRLHEATGWRIVDEESTPGSIEELRKIQLAEEFHRYPEEDLLVYETWIVSAAV